MTFSFSAFLERVSMTAGQIALLASLPLAAVMIIAGAV